MFGIAQAGDAKQKVGVTGSEVSPVRSFFSTGGVMGAAIAAFDWSSTPLGPIADWRGELLAAVGVMLQTDYPHALWWGPERILLHNDHYLDLLAERGASLGRTAADVWADADDPFFAHLDEVERKRHGLSKVDLRIDFVRAGRTDERYWNFAMTPILGREGEVLGVLNGVRETTSQVLRRQADALLLDLDDQLLAAAGIDTVIAAALATIGEHLGARRTGYAEVDPVTHTLAIFPCWVPGALPDIEGLYPLGTFGNITDELRQGQVVVIADNRTDPRTSDAATLERYDRIGLRSGIVVPVIDNGRYAGGLFVQDDVPRSWTRHQVMLVQSATHRLWHALKRLRTEIAMRESEQRYRLIFEQANDIIFTADIDQRITACNAAAARALGLSREAIVGASIADFVSAADFEQTSAMLRHKLDHGGNTRHEVGVTGADGRAMRWENDSTVIVDRDGKAMGLLSISRDVTERRAFDERQRLLINELNHRVKNALALVQAIAHQSFRPGVESATAQRDFLARLGTLAKAHDLLTREHWEGVTMAEIVRAATAAFDAARVEAQGPPLRLTPKAAVAVAMALHELGTNAMKYGALSTPAGCVQIGWSSDAERFCLGWQEHDGPPVTAPSRRGFGVKMVERALASDLHGSVSVAFLPQGVQCAIDAPLQGNIQ